MFHYVYRITCTHPLFTKGPKHYYGSRSSKVPAENDFTYWSSSKLIKKWRFFCGQEFFKKKIVSRHKTREQALNKEIRLHERFNVKDNPFFFNQSNQTSTKFLITQPLTDPQKGKLREKALGRKHSEEARKKMSDAHRGKKRKPLSESHREKIRQALLNKKPHSSETREKMSKAAKERKKNYKHTSLTKQKISQKMMSLYQEQRAQKREHVCPWCQKSGRAPGIFVWHFSKCRLQLKAADQLLK